MSRIENRRMLHAARGIRRVVDPAEVLWLEAVPGGTLAHLKGGKSLRDLRPLGLVSADFEESGFLLIHRNHMVNLEAVREIRRRPRGRDWEVKLSPPENRILPVGRDSLQALWDAFGGG